jgi:hypothetical protein
MKKCYKKYLTKPELFKKLYNQIYCHKNTRGEEYFCITTFNKVICHYIFDPNINGKEGINIEIKF